MNETKRLTTTALMVAIAVVIALLLYIIPLPLIFLVAIPLVVVGVQYKVKYQGLAIIAVTLIMMIIDPIYGVTILFLVGPLSLVLAYCIDKEKTNSLTIFLSGLGVFFGLILMLLVAQNVLGINIMGDTMDMIDLSVDQITEIYTEGDLLSDEDKITTKALFEQQRDAIKLLMPSFMIMFGMINGLLAFVFSKLIFKRTGIKMVQGKFKDFRINRELRGTLLIVIIVVTIGSIIDKQNGEVYILNFVTLLVLLLQVNALALVWFKTDHKSNKKTLRVLTIVGLVVSSLFGSVGTFVKMGFALIGFLDMHIDFRKRSRHLE